MPIAERLLTIANNTPKLCKKLFTKKTVSGSVISVGDVCSIEHNLEVSLTSDTITDLNGITVSRYGKNLFDSTKLENGLNAGSAKTPLEIVEFNGRTCLKSVVNADNKYGNYDDIILDVPVYCVCYEAYSSSYTKSIFTLHFEDGTAHNVPPSNDINNWRRVQKYSKKIVKIASYFRPTTDEEAVYIVKGSICAFIDTEDTEYESYKEPQTAIANADGTVNGLTSLSPNMTLIADNNDINIQCSYRYGDNPSNNNKFIKLKNAFESLKETLKNI